MRFNVGAFGLPHSGRGSNLLKSPTDPSRLLPSSPQWRAYRHPFETVKDMARIWRSRAPLLSLGAGRPVPPYFMMKDTHQSVYIKVDRYFRVASHVKFCLGRQLGNSFIMGFRTN